MNTSDDSSYYEDDEDEEDEPMNPSTQMEMPYPGSLVERIPDPTLPETVTLLTTEDGAKVYLVGTAHFSENSQADVTQVPTQQAQDVDSMLV